MTALKALEKERKKASTLDREGLLDELVHYKRFSFSQFETIRLLQVEIRRIKKLAAQQTQTAPKPHTSVLVAKDPDSLPVRDSIELQKEIGHLKELLLESEQQKRELKAARDKYERRAKYTIEKFNEIKQKEMQLIQMGEDKVRSEVNLNESKLRRKVEE